MKLELDFTPPSTNSVYRKRGAGYGMFMTEEGQQFKQVVGLLARAKWGSKPSKKSITMRVVLQFSDKRRRDVDGFHKLLQDALQGIVYENDSQIISLHIEKTTGDTPKTFVELTEC